MHTRFNFPPSKVKVRFGQQISGLPSREGFPFRLGFHSNWSLFGVKKSQVNPLVSLSLLFSKVSGGLLRPPWVIRERRGHLWFPLGWDHLCCGFTPSGFRGGFIRPFGTLCLRAPLSGKNSLGPWCVKTLLPQNFWCSPVVCRRGVITVGHRGWCPLGGVGPLRGFLRRPGRSFWGLPGPLTWECVASPAHCVLPRHLSVGGPFWPLFSTFGTGLRENAESCGPPPRGFLGERSSPWGSTPSWLVVHPGGS